MFNFLKFLFLFFFLFEVFLNNSFDDKDLFIHNNMYAFWYLTFLVLNFFLNDEKKTKLDFDILIKYIFLIVKTPNFLFNYIVNILKKISVYLVFFKYKHFYNSIYIFLKKYTNNTIILWRPLFKKTSYFGYFRSNRSKWIK